MNTIKRTANCASTNDQKRLRKDVVAVKKINFRRSNEELTIDRVKDYKVKKTSTLDVRRSRRSKRRSLNGSCSESEMVDDRKKVEPSMEDDQPVRKREKSLTGLKVAEEKNRYCSTPNRTGNDIQDCEAELSARYFKREQTNATSVSSPFGFKSLINSSSFCDDDGVLAALNLSEIITSSAALNRTQGNLAILPEEEENQFYGLPLKVKELLQKYKGIDSLYGKLV